MMKLFCKMTAGSLCALFLIGAALEVAPSAKEVYAQTTEALQAQLAALLAEVAAVQAQMSAAPPVSQTLPLVADISVTFRFSRTLRAGMRVADVRRLQIALNRDPDTRVAAPGAQGSAGNETDYFGAATRAAVVRFQNKYAAEVLAPAGLARGTGIVGALTRAKLNGLLSQTTPPAIPAAVAPPISPRPPPPTAPLPEPPAASTTASLVPTFSWNEVNQKTRDALVNIICTTKRSGFFNPVSGSGIMIDQSGIILTNAHVAQYLLLKDYLTPDFVECLIRQGAPARNRYKARLLYIAPQWVERNYRKIRLAEPTGTGEHDFALLLITESINQATLPLPASFVALAPDWSDATIRGEKVALVAGYPAGFLGGISIQKELYPASSIVTTGNVYSFRENTPDLFSVESSVLAQQGASGGAVVNREGKLIGMISTATDAPTTGERTLNAVTPSHLARSFAERNAFSLQDMLAEADLAKLADEFNRNVAPALTKLLTDELNRKP